MKKQIIRRHDFFNVIDNPYKPGIATELNKNRTKINRVANHLFMDCPVCGITFSRKASEAKRNNISYCSRACCAVSQRRQVKVNCKVCKKEYTVKQCHVDVITCCGPECKSHLARINANKIRGDNGRLQR